VIYCTYLIEKNPSPRGDFLFTMFPHQEPCVRGPPSKDLYQVLIVKVLILKLSKASFCFCETYLLHIKLFVVNTIWPKTGPFRGVFWMIRFLSVRKRSFLETQKADQKHCENCYASLFQNSTKHPQCASEVSGENSCEIQSLNQSGFCIYQIRVFFSGVRSLSFRE